MAPKPGFMKCLSFHPVGMSQSLLAHIYSTFGWLKEFIDVKMIFAIWQYWVKYLSSFNVSLFEAQSE